MAPKVFRKPAGVLKRPSGPAEDEGRPPMKKPAADLDRQSFADGGEGVPEHEGEKDGGEEEEEEDTLR
eukprot:3066285-Alexandrium_andersonii.AAC.1